MADPIVKFKIPSLGIKDVDYNKLPFGRQIEYRRAIADWIETAKIDYISQKRKCYQIEINKFIKFNEVKEYYCRFNSSEFNFDDSFKIYWK